VRIASCGLRWRSKAYAETTHPLGTVSRLTGRTAEVLVLRAWKRRCRTGTSRQSEAGSGADPINKIFEALEPLGGAEAQLRPLADSSTDKGSGSNRTTPKRSDRTHLRGFDQRIRRKTDRANRQQKSERAAAPYRLEIRSLRSRFTRVSLPKPRESAGIFRVAGRFKGEISGTRD